MLHRLTWLLLGIAVSIMMPVALSQPTDLSDRQERFERLSKSARPDLIAGRSPQPLHAASQRRTEQWIVDGCARASPDDTDLPEEIGLLSEYIQRKVKRPA